MYNLPLYLQEELTVFIALLEYYILSIKQGDENWKRKTSQEVLVSQERASQLNDNVAKYGSWGCSD
jgi:hypothetical protein